MKELKKEKTNKKWTPEEIKSILNYLEDVENIEVPTAQIFYKKLIEKCNIDASWDLIRWKVRYLKSTYKKAQDWRNSTGAGLLEGDTGIESVEAKVLKMCPNYNQLCRIFGEKKQSQMTYEILDTGELTQMELNSTETSGVLGVEENFCCQTEIDFESAIEDSPGGSANTTSTDKEVSKKAKEFSEKIKKSVPKSSSAYLATFQIERTALFKMKFEWEKERHDEEIAISRKRLALEEKKTNEELEISKKRVALEEVKSSTEMDLMKKEMDLKMRKIESDERLRILEIEKDERVKRFEIEMKYKQTNN